MSIFNNWDEDKIIKKDQIKEFEFLKDNSYINEIEDDYYYLSANINDVERAFYEIENKKIANELDLKDVQKEITSFIKKLNNYNKAKDVAENLMGKIAELRGVTIKSVHEDLDMIFEDD